MNISDTSPGATHCVSEKWESFIFGKTICAQAQHVGEVILSGFSYWTLVGDRGVKKLSYFQPRPGHKEDQSQLQVLFFFSFKVGEEA